MRGRLYYTAKAKKKGKVMIKIHPCSRLCFCKCWVCFKEVTGKGIGGHSRGARAPGLQALSRALGSAPCPHPGATGLIQVCSVLRHLAPAFLSTRPISLLRGVFLGAPSRVIQGGLFLPPPGLGWEDQRGHSRLL